MTYHFKWFLRKTMSIWIPVRIKHKKLSYLSKIPKKWFENSPFFVVSSKMVSLIIKLFMQIKQRVTRDLFLSVETLNDMFFIHLEFESTYHQEVYLHLIQQMFWESESLFRLLEEFLLICCWFFHHKKIFVELLGARGKIIGRQSSFSSRWTFLSTVFCHSKDFAASWHNFVPKTGILEFENLSVLAIHPVCFLLRVFS